MAVVFEEDKDKKDENQQTAGGMPQTGGGGQVASTAMSRQQEGSGQAPNIRKYIQANQGGASQLTEGLQEQAQKQSENLQKGLSSSRQAFEQQAGELEGKLGEQGQQTSQMAFKDPQAILQDQQRLDEFKRLQSQGYQDQIGQTAQDLTPYQQQQQALQSAGQMAGTESGRFQMLQQTFGKPSYSQGQQRLDQLLLQGDPTASRDLQYNINQMAQQAGQGIGQFSEEQQARLAALQDLSGQRASEIENMLQFGTDAEGLEADLSGRGLRDIQSDLESRLQDIQATAPQEADALRERLAANQLFDRDLSVLGLDPGQRLYDVDLAKYMNQSNFNPSIANISQQDEFARYQALRQLAGDQEADLFGGATEVGGFKPYEYDTEALRQAIANRESSVNELFAETKQALSNPWYQSGKDQVQWYLDRWGDDSQIGKVFRAIQDVRDAEQPSYEQLQNVISQYEQNPQYFRGSSSVPFAQSIERLKRQLPQYQYNRMVNATPEEANLESGGYFNVT